MPRVGCRPGEQWSALDGVIEDVRQYLQQNAFGDRGSAFANSTRFGLLMGVGDSKFMLEPYRGGALDAATMSGGLYSFSQLKALEMEKPAAGVRRAPQVTTWGWNQAAVAKLQAPTLMITGVHDKQVPPERVKTLYDDAGSRQKVFVDLACSSHNAIWERNHLLLFQASLEWLTRTTVKGNAEGMVNIGH